jgi:exonuclease III
LVTKIAGGERQSFEYSVWKVKFTTQRISVIIIYRPRYSETHRVTTSVFYSKFSEYLESVVLKTDPVLIVGDFKIHVDCDDNTNAIKLIEIFESVELDLVIKMKKMSKI